MSCTSLKLNGITYDLKIALDCYSLFKMNKFIKKEGVAVYIKETHAYTKIHESQHGGPDERIWIKRK